MAIRNAVKCLLTFIWKQYICYMNYTYFLITSKSFFTCHDSSLVLNKKPNKILFFFKAIFEMFAVTWKDWCKSIHVKLLMWSENWWKIKKWKILVCMLVIKNLMDWMTAITSWTLWWDFYKIIYNLPFDWSENWFQLANTSSNLLIPLSCSNIFIDKFDHITHSSNSIVNLD